jgi:hypothetical protein
MNWTSLFSGLGGGGGGSTGGGFNWGALGSALGLIGSAVSPKDSWQQGLGQAGTAINMSNIYGKAQEKATQEKNSYMDTLIKALGGLTPDGEKGPTSYSQNADGTFTVKGNTGPVPGVGPGTKVGGVGQGDLTLGSPSVGPTSNTPSTPSTPGGVEEASNPWSNFMKALSGFQGSPAGLTRADYAGLTPEMIDALAGRQAQGQDQSLRTLVFLNEMLGPKAGRIVEGADSYMLVDEVTGQVRNLGIPIHHDPKIYDTVATEQGLMYKTPYGLVPTGQMPHSGGVPQPEKLVQFQFHYPGVDGKMVNDTRIIPQGEWNNYAKMVQSQGGEVGHIAQPTPPRPGDLTEQERALTTAESKTGLVTPETHANKYLPDNAGYIYKPGKKKDWWPDTKAEFITLPKGWTKGMVQKYADAKQIPDLYEAYQQMLVENSQLRGK